MSEIIEVPVYDFDSELEKIIRSGNTFQKRFKQYDFQNLDWNDDVVTAKEGVIIAGGLAIVFLLIFFLLRGSVKNQKSRSHVPTTDPQQRRINRRIYKQEQAIAKQQEILDKPEINTRNWDVHQQRLSLCGQSLYRGTMFYVGPKGGVYYITYRGTKVYC